jgi:hypothetical protein
MSHNVSKEEWIAMFKEVGLDKDAMGKWHQLFEKRHPDAHNDFLKWLGLSSTEIADIRANSK